MNFVTKVIKIIEILTIWRKIVSEKGQWALLQQQHPLHIVDNNIRAGLD
jgi:hypothetical protein